MGTTLTALIGDTGVSLRFVAAIEGYPYLITNAATAAAVAAWSGTDWSAALGGLEIDWNLDQRLQPWEPFNSSSSSVTLRIQDVSGTNADTFGLSVFKREGMASSPLYADVDPGDATVTVKRASGFAASGNVYLGCETIAYTGNDNATNPGTLSTLTRAKYSPFKHDDGGGFQRTHRRAGTIPGPEIEAGTSALVADAPLDWRGRWVGIWIHRDMGGVLDVKAQAHLAFAGRISNVADAPDGRTVVQVDEVRQVISDAVIMREQWRAIVKEGVTLVAGTQFKAGDGFHFNSGGVFVDESEDANPLVVVSAGAATVNEINAGFYSGADIATRINEWLAAELVLGNLLFRHTFSYVDTDPAGNARSSLRFSEDGATTQAYRETQLTATNADVRAFMGWNDDGIKGGTHEAYEGIVYSTFEPRAASVNFAPGSTLLQVQNAQGSFANQAAFVGHEPTVEITPVGYLKIGDSYFTCEAPSITNGSGTVRVGRPVNTSVGSEMPERWWSIGVDEGGELEVTQVLILESSFTALVLALLSSAGGNLNWTLYDVLPEHCSAAIPYDLMGTDLEGELYSSEGGLDVMTVIVDKPTRFVDLFGASFTMRLIQFIWHQGRLAVRGYATPTTAATLTITADDRATAVDVSDDLIAATVESDALMRNVIKIKHSYDATGESARDSITIQDPGSSSNFGARILTINARNSISGTGDAGEDVIALLPHLISGLVFLSRPQMTIRVPLDHNMIEQATPGTVCLLTDGFARDPATGLRGIAAKPSIVLAQRASWGGPDEPPRCEVDLMIFPRLSLAAYSPCAQVDDTAPTGGYVAGTKVLTCYAEEHSDAGLGDPADATRFLVGDKVRVVEIDPPVAAAPLTWDDTVANQAGNTITLTVGLAGWDAAKRYRVISDTYGDAVTAQRSKAYQADDADGQVVDSRAPYAMGYFGTGQRSWGFQTSAATELPERPPTLAYGDGAALDTGHARAVAVGVNNLISYKTAPQNPSALAAAEVMAYGGAPTWLMAWCEPVHIGIGIPSNVKTRKLYVSPTIAKSGGASANIRVTLARRLPKSADPSNPSLDDETRIAPYVSTTFNTTSATYENQSAVGLDVSHLQLAMSRAGGGGIGWIYVELGANALYRGMGVRYLGPLEAP